MKSSLHRKIAFEDEEGQVNLIRLRYARRSRLENQPTDPAAAGRYVSYL